LFLQLVLSFFDQVKLIGFDVAENLPLTTGPSDLDAVRPWGLSKSEVGPHITL